MTMKWFNVTVTVLQSSVFHSLAVSFLFGACDCVRFCMESKCRNMHRTAKRTEAEAAAAVTATATTEASNACEHA